MNCQDCDLCITRSNVVSGTGVHNKLMFIGEAPGYHEDKLGKPFVGMAGQHLTLALTSVGINRNEDCYITNVVKCRPPSNNTPTNEEVLSCYKYLITELQIVKPMLIILLGNLALRAVTSNFSLYITNEHGKWFGNRENIIAIYHPSYAMRNLNYKVDKLETNKDFYLDLIKVRDKYNYLNHILYGT
jgi:uracil-DNA glycosylase